MPETLVPTAPVTPTTAPTSLRRPRRSAGQILGRIALYASVVVGAVIMLFPFLWTVVTSITPSGSLSGGPSLIVEDPTLDAYRTLADSMPIGRIIANSFLVAIVSTVLQLVTASMAAYAFGRLEFTAKPVVFA